MSKTKNKRFRKGVFIVVYFLDGKIPKYLILKRKLHWKGWEFPKGGVEKFETKRGAVRRELKEETGLAPLKIKKHDYSGKFPYPKPLSDRPGFAGQTFSLYSVEVAPGKARVDKNEDTEYKWLDFKSAEKKLTWKDQKKALKIADDWMKGK